MVDLFSEEAGLVAAPAILDVQRNSVPYEKVSGHEGSFTSGCKKNKV
jgi:hypothetical protein